MPGHPSNGSPGVDPRSIEAMVARMAGGSHVVVACITAVDDPLGRDGEASMAQRVAVARRFTLEDADIVLVEAGVVVCVVHDADTVSCERRFDRFADQLWASGPFVLGYAQQRGGEAVAAIVLRAMTAHQRRSQDFG